MFCFNLFKLYEGSRLFQLVVHSDTNVDAVGSSVKQSSLRSAPSSSSSSSTGAAHRSTSPFRRRRSEEKKSSENDKSSSAHVIDPSDASAVAELYTSAGAMDDIERRLECMKITDLLYGGVACAHDVALSGMLLVPLVGPLPSLAAPVGTKSGSKRIFSAADVNAFPSIYDLFNPSLQIWRSPQSRRVVVKLDDEVMGREVAVCEVGGIVEKGLSAAGLRMEDVVLSPAAIALAVLEEREEVEDGERGGKEGEEKGEEKGEDGRREGDDGNEEKGGYPTAHREFVKRIKENQGKLEEAMAQLVVEAFGLSWLRFVKADAEAGADKQHSVEPEVCSSSPSDGIQQENRRAAEEEAADGSLGITSDGSE